jgi:hypothetical protein
MTQEERVQGGRKIETQGCFDDFESVPDVSDLDFNPFLMGPGAENCI